MWGSSYRRLPGLAASSACIAPPLPQGALALTIHSVSELCHNAGPHCVLSLHTFPQGNTDTPLMLFRCVDQNGEVTG